MKLRNRSVTRTIALLPLLFLAIFAATEASSSAAEGTALSQSTNTKTMLRGSLSHSVELSGTETELNIGAQFDERMLPHLNQTNDWYQVPHWSAFACGRSKGRIHLYYNYKKPVALCERRIIPYVSHSNSCQLDAFNDVWVPCWLPFFCRERNSNDIDITCITSHTVVEVTSDSITFADKAYCVRIDNDTHRVLDINPAFEWRTSYYTGVEGQVRAINNPTDFDKYGNPTNLALSQCITVKAAPRTVRDKSDSKNLKNSFTQYLIAHDLAYLVPRTDSD